MRSRCASSGTCWTHTNEGNRSWDRLVCTWRGGGCESRRARSWTRPSCTHPLRPRTGSSSAIRRCTRRRRANNGYFGMKAHVGVDSKTKIIHTAVATAANVADSAVLLDLLQVDETRVWGDQAYRGQSEVIRECAPQAQDCTHR